VHLDDLDHVPAEDRQVLFAEGLHRARPASRLSNSAPPGPFRAA
jgi:hypothetical protein